MTAYDLPLVNATLNGSAAVLLILGYIAVKAGMIRLHKASMLTALATSGVFLVCSCTTISPCGMGRPRVTWATGGRLT